MKQNWKQFGMNSAPLSGVDMDKKQHLKTLLSGAVFEYLDENLIKDFVLDLIEILNTESAIYSKKAESFSFCAELVQKGMEAMAEESKEGA